MTISVVRGPILPHVSTAGTETAFVPDCMIEARHRGHMA